MSLIVSPLSCNALYYIITLVPRNRGYLVVFMEDCISEAYTSQTYCSFQETMAYAANRGYQGNVSTDESGTVEPRKQDQLWDQKKWSYFEDGPICEWMNKVLFVSG